MKNLALKDIVFDLDTVLDMMCTLQIKAREKANKSEDEDFKFIVNQYELIKDRLVNQELPQLFELAKN